MSPGFRKTLRFAGVPVDSSETGTQTVRQPHDRYRDGMPAPAPGVRCPAVGFRALPGYLGRGRVYRPLRGRR